MKHFYSPTNGYCVMDQAPSPLGDWVEVPERPGPDYVWGGEAWNEPPRWQSLDEAKADLTRQIQAECESRIEGGFVSSALGVAHTYPSKLNPDQANLSANVLSSLMPGVDENWVTYHTCADENGVWAFRPHTAAQIQQVGVDIKQAILAIRIANGQKLAEVTHPDFAFEDAEGYNVQAGWPE